MNNCSIDKSDKLEDMITATGAHLIYLLPYPSDFLPTENCWSKTKAIFCRIETRTYGAVCGVGRSQDPAM